MIRIDPERFREERMSHNGIEEFFRQIGQDPNRFQPIHLSVAYVHATDDDTRIRETELNLARTAMARGCEYVTNIDYCGPCIAATGQKLKKT
jgi:hypothetical protein